MFIIPIFQVFFCLSIGGSPMPTAETRTHNAANELQGIATHDAKSFFNENWQEVESVTGSEMTSYVWGVRYIDDLVLREKGEERLYSLADPNWNVVALIDATGAVMERMKYDAFGKITWLDAGFGVKTNSDYGWNRTFTGQVLDVETMLMLYRNRYYNMILGRFVNRDPIGYEAGDVSLYRYVFNRSYFFTDAEGLLPIQAGACAACVGLTALKAWRGHKTCRGESTWTEYARCMLWQAVGPHNISPLMLCLDDCQNKKCLTSRESRLCYANCFLNLILDTLIDVGQLVSCTLCLGRISSNVGKPVRTLNPPLTAAAHPPIATVPPVWPKTPLLPPGTPLPIAL